MGIGQARCLYQAFFVVLAAMASGCGGTPDISAGPGGPGGTNTGATGAGAGGTAGTGGTGAGASDTGGTGTTTGKPTFELDAHTSVTPDSGLALTTNLPATTTECAAAPFEGTPCADLDQDGLADAWEDLVIDRYRPLQRLDEAESLVTDPTTVMADIARVALVEAAPLHVRVFIVLAYHKDYGSCGFTSHNGDPERVALDLVAVGSGPGDVASKAHYTAAHEGTASDHSMLFEGADLAQLVFEDDAATGEPRWVVFPSRDKHGTYASIDICENVSPIPCFSEACAPDGVANPADFDRLPIFINAGEEAHPLVTELSAIGFPGDDAWADQEFCGGQGGGTCSAKVRDKLLTDPFAL